MWRVLVAVLRGHLGPITDVAFSKDESRIATASQDGSIRVWDTKTGTLLSTFVEPEFVLSSFHFVSFGSDDLELTAGSSNGIVTWRTTID